MNISTTWILIPTASILTTVGQVNLLWLLKEGRSASSSTRECSQQKSHSVGESQSRKRHSSKPEQDLIPCPLNVTDFRHDVEHIYNRFLIAWPQKRTLSNHRKPWRHLGWLKVKLLLFSLRSGGALICSPLNDGDGCPLRIRSKNTLEGSGSRRRCRQNPQWSRQTPSTGLRHPSFNRLNRDGTLFFNPGWMCLIFTCVR